MSFSHLFVFKMNKQEYYATVQQLCYQQNIFLRDFDLRMFNCILFYSDVCTLCICMYQFNYLITKINTQINTCVLFLFMFKLQNGGGGGGGGEV